MSSPIKQPQNRATSQEKRAAVGFRVHSGWAAMVVVGGSKAKPRLVSRPRLELAGPEPPRPVQPFHVAQKMSLEDAERYIKQIAHRAELLALQAIRAAVEKLKVEESKVAGFQLVACGIPVGSGRLAPDLKAILASHPQLHMAEGVLFRKAIASAARRLNLNVLEVPERDLITSAVKRLGLPANGLQSMLNAIGKPLGPPWTQDQKVATLAAWLALAENSD